jgi:endogenous inhibitor of DNA gyrase (YacG/DUF329 family)
MAAHAPGAGRGKCPICGRPTEAAFRPFCSPRCADVDLARWLSGGYAIPGEAESEDGGEVPPTPRSPGEETDRQG